MSQGHMDRLTSIDASFLTNESPTSHMHVGAVLIFEGPPPQYDDFVEHVESRLPLVPRFRQKLATPPLQAGRPVWVDDHRFNLDYHLRHTALPEPGSVAQLRELSARIMQQHLDRSRPLWEMWLVEGLEGDRFALISKVHHCMIDGVSGVDLMNAQLKTTPDREIPEDAALLPAPGAVGLELLRHELLRRAALPFAAFRDVRNFMREADDARLEIAVRVRAVAETLGTTFRRPSDTPLNRPIGPHRRFDWMPMEVAEIKEVRRALGGSLNDVVLTVVTGAVRSFLERAASRRAGSTSASWRRSRCGAADQRGQLGNRIAAMRGPLPVYIGDPVARLAVVRDSMEDLKSSKQALGAEVISRPRARVPASRCR